MSDDQDVRSNGAQHSELPLENRAAADPERALVSSAGSPRLPSGKDRCSPHQSLVGSGAAGSGYFASAGQTCRLPTAVTLSENATHD